MVVHLHHLPPRIACGAFILNTGLTKRSLDAEAATGLRNQAAVAFAPLKKMDPVHFGKVLSTAEIILGAALLVPAVPTWLAAAGLTGFSGALMRMYFMTPLGLLIDELTERLCALSIPGWKQ